MQRRKFLKTAGLAAAATTVAAPAIAQSMPELKWRLTVSWPKSLDTLFGACEHFAKRVGEITDNKFQIRVFAAGEIVPGLQVLDAVQNGTVEMGHTASYYYFGKDPTFAFDTAMCFGLNARQQFAWMHFGGGLQLLREFYKDFNVHLIPCGNTGAQMGGWYRKEIKTVEDLKGLKMRIGGQAGLVMAKLGVVPQQLAGGDIYPALEKGTIDAAEWVGPYDDEKLGFDKVAQYYYYPGWWEGGPQVSLYINTKSYDTLSPTYKAAVDAAAAEANGWMVAKYDALNPPALKRLAAKKVQFRPFSRAVLDACYKSSVDLYAEISAKNARFKKVYESWLQFRSDQNLWFRFSESTFDNYMGHLSATKRS